MGWTNYFGDEAIRKFVRSVDIACAQKRIFLLTIKGEFFFFLDDGMIAHAFCNKINKHKN